MGPPSRRSSALPCGIPSMTSKSTTSPRPFSAQRCASVPPIMPAPMSAIFFRGMWLLKSKTVPGCKPSRLEPQARETDIDRVERLDPDDVFSGVRRGDDPALILEPVDLERAGERIDDPEMSHPLACVDAHLPPAVDRARRR